MFRPLPIVFVALTVIGAGCAPDESRLPVEEGFATSQAALQTFVVTNNEDSGEGSLRQAIEDVNERRKPALIAFELPSDATVIKPERPLPAITAPGVVVDGLTQPGASCDAWPPKLVVELDGRSLSPGGVSQNSGVLELKGGDGLVRGLVVGGLQNQANKSASGILLSSSNNKVQCNYLGTDATGLERRPNDSGVRVASGAGNVVGVVEAETERNLVSGNGRVEAVSCHSCGGVHIAGGSETFVSGNYIGTDPTGERSVPNENGILISGGSAAIVGVRGDETSSALQRNIVSGNRATGIRVRSTSRNRIQGNYIGTNVGGDEALENGFYGIMFENDQATGNVVGLYSTTDAGWELEGNVISGNKYVGIEFQGGKQNRVSGNLIGTDATGLKALPNGQGIKLDRGASNNIIGTDGDGVGDEAERNVISGNSSDGLTVGTNAPSSPDNQVAGNYIGTDITGLGALANGKGVYLWPLSEGTLVGTHGDGSAHDRNRGNVISGNRLEGVHVRGAGALVGVRIAGNRIGVGADGSTALGNLKDGVDIYGVTGQSPNELVVGGPAPHDANVIAYNRTGVVVGETSTVRIERNSIFSNRERGIRQVSQYGSVGNKGQPAPRLTNVVVGNDVTRAEAVLVAQPNSVYAVEFFDNARCHASGNGEGQTFLAAVEVTTDDEGQVVFEAEIGEVIANPHQVTATATDRAGNTSEFSSCVDNPAPTTLTIDAPAGMPYVGETIEVTFQVKAKAPAWGVPTGTVSVDGGAGTCDATLDEAGEGRCEVVVVRTPLTATYSGDELFAPTDGSRDVTLRKQGSTVTVTVEGDSDVWPPQSGMSGRVVFEVTGEASTPIPTGVVDVQSASSGLLCGGLELDANGRGSCDVVFRTGQQTFSVSYRGDDAHEGKQGTASVTVEKLETVTVIASVTPNPARIGEKFTVTFAVGPQSGVTSATVPTGQAVCSYDGSPPYYVVLQAGGDGTGTCLLDARTAGTANLVVEYRGSDDALPSSAEMPLEVLGVHSLALEGSGQSAVVGKEFDEPLTVIVTNRLGEPVAGRTVEFTQGSMLEEPTAGLSLGSTTDDDGKLTVRATANGFAGSYSLPVSVDGVSAAFELTNLPDKPEKYTFLDEDDEPLEGSRQSTVVGQRFPRALKARITDRLDNPIAGARLVLTPPVTGASASFSPADGVGVTDADGIASVEATANAVAGSYDVQATVEDSALSFVFELENTPLPADDLLYVAGSPQWGPLEGAFEEPLIVRVTDSLGEGVADAFVRFASPVGTAGARLGEDGLSHLEVRSDADGYASVMATANDEAGCYEVEASVDGLDSRVSFRLLNLAPGDVVATLSVVSGAEQSTTVATPFAVPLRAKVEPHCAGWTFEQIEFSSPASGASATLSDDADHEGAEFSARVDVDASGEVVAWAKANEEAGEYEVVANIEGGSPATFALANTASTAAQISAEAVSTPQSARVNEPFAEALTVVVVDAYGNPVSGVEVVFAAPTVGPTALLGDLSVATGADGRASVTATASTQAGAYEVEATVDGMSARFALTNTADPDPGSMFVTVISGSGQSAVVTDAFEDVLEVRVTDRYGNPVSGSAVTFSASENGAGAGLEAADGATGAELVVLTDETGAARVKATANEVAGSHEARAAFANGNVETFELTNIAARPVRIVVVSGGGQATAVFDPFGDDVVVRVEDPFGNPVPDEWVVFESPDVHTLPGVFFGTCESESCRRKSDANGETDVYSLWANEFAGTYEVTVTLETLPGEPAVQTSFELTNLPVEGVLVAESGTPQSAPVTEAFGEPLALVVRTSHGRLIAGQKVVFSAPTSGASASLSETVVVTDEDGRVEVLATANETAGAYLVTARLTELPEELPEALRAQLGELELAFELENLPGPAASLTADVGATPQSAQIGTPYAEALSVAVRDAFGNLVSGEEITFSAPTVGASALLSAESDVSDETGVASVTAIANHVVGSFVVTAGVNDMTATFELTNLVGSPATVVPIGGGSQSAVVFAAFAEPLVVAVFDAGENPVPGVEVTFAVPETGASATAASLTAITDERGQASMSVVANEVAGEYSVGASAAGTSSPAVFALANTLMPTTTTLLSDATAVEFGEDVLLTLKVEAAEGTPAGDVAIVEGSSTLATVSLANGAAEVSLTLAAGEHALVAEYAGNETFAPSRSEALSVVVGPDADESQYVTASGGGLSCASGGGAGWTALLFAAIALAWRRRRAVAWAAVVALPLVSSAEGFDLDRHRAATFGSDGLTLERPTSLERGKVGASLTLSYARNPLVETLRAGDGAAIETRSLVRNQFNGALSLAYGLFDRVSVHGTLPFSVLQSGDAASASSFLPTAGSTAIGDVRLGGRVRLMGGLEGDEPSKGGLGLDVSVLLPTGSTASYLSDGNVRGEARLLGELLPTRFLYAGANVGVMLRPGVALGPDALGSSLIVGAGAGYRDALDKMRLGIEANSDIAFAGSEGASSAAVEAYAVASWRFLRGFQATVGAGPGLTDAIGTATWRGLVRVGWSPNAEQSAPAVVAEPEPVLMPEPQPVVELEPAPEPEPVVELEPEPEPELEPEPVPPALPEEVVKVVKAFEITQRIYFEYGEATLLPRSDGYLSTVARLLHENPSVHVSIEGHTDDHGTAEFNQALSERRAAAVREALVAKGVEAVRLTIKGHGKSRPIADNDSDAGRERNRRVEFIVVN